jgi:hypothetical protein
MSSVWQPNALSAGELDPQVLSSMTTILDTQETDTSRVYFPLDFKPQEIKSKAAGLSLDFCLNRMSYTANDSVEGTFMIKCTSNAIKLGKIELRLVGFEGKFSLN